MAQRCRASAKNLDSPFKLNDSPGEQAKYDQNDITDAENASTATAEGKLSVVKDAEQTCIKYVDESIEMEHAMG
eukprot:CAMPEP_0202697742 /NCGR_PEP_ID=MMETSP1385-20130828/11052_1 /ASSEMBLY_ACC=CAM_ASM_000861 /TAXON_ID=933848 /ORGANISM="Elphidium margaritaceum" /LENGTH=73 /DNA_ID=CAMNT_0049354267 /DNA_START=546 /DNA_END=768 /DNA_ORIENTATION=+